MTVAIGRGESQFSTRSGLTSPGAIQAVVKVQKIYPVNRDDPFFGYAYSRRSLSDCYVSKGSNWYIEPVGDGKDDDPNGPLGKANFTVSEISTTTQEVILRADVSGPHLSLLDFKYGIANVRDGGKITTPLTSLTHGSTIHLPKGHLAVVTYKDQIHHVIYNERALDHAHLLGIGVF